LENRGKAVEIANFQLVLRRFRNAEEAGRKAGQGDVIERIDPGRRSRRAVVRDGEHQQQQLQRRRRRAGEQIRSTDFRRHPRTHSLIDCDLFGQQQ